MSEIKSNSVSKVSSLKKPHEFLSPEQRAKIKAQHLAGKGAYKPKLVYASFETTDAVGDEGDDVALLHFLARGEVLAYRSSGNDPRYDLVFESGLRVEVKKDQMMTQTHNAFIEVFQSRNPSGLMVTEADVYAIVEGNHMLHIIPVPPLKCFIKMVKEDGSIALKPTKNNKDTQAYPIPRNRLPEISGYMKFPPMSVRPYVWGYKPIVSGKKRSRELVFEMSGAWSQAENEKFGYFYPLFYDGQPLSSQLRNQILNDVPEFAHPMHGLIQEFIKHHVPATPTVFPEDLSIVNSIELKSFKSGPQSARIAHIRKELIKIEFEPGFKEKFQLSEVKRLARCFDDDGISQLLPRKETKMLALSPLFCVNARDEKWLEVRAARNKAKLEHPQMTEDEFLTLYTGQTLAQYELTDAYQKIQAKMDPPEPAQPGRGHTARVIPGNKENCMWLAPWV